MWNTVSHVIQFVGYVFAFWLMWRLFDGLVHKASRKKKDVPHCEHCVNYERQIKDLQQRTRFAEEKAKENHRLDKITEEAIAIGQLNLASKTEIEEIDGIGPVKAGKIMSHRPFFSWIHFEGIEPRHSVRNSILRWAKARVGLIHRPQPRHWNQ